MEPLRTTELRCFIVIAEELHFGRSAARLGITQPQLSRTIRSLESRLGVRLLERSSRVVRLTPAGQVLLDEGRKVLASMAAAIERVQRAGRPVRKLTLSMKPGKDGGLLPDILAAYEGEPQSVPVELVICSTRERLATLHNGAADVALLHRPPSDLSGFDTIDLLKERQVAVLPRDHLLAGRASVCLADLEREPGPCVWSGPGTPDSHSFQDAAELAQMIALGRATAVAPESVRGYLRHDLTSVIIRDAPLATLILAWPAQQRDLALAAFVRAAAEVAQAREPAREMRL
jgi:DNA-binding transcriptional LysR family regulator